MKIRTGIIWIGIVLMCRCSLGQELQNPSFEKEGAASDRAESWERWGDWINREINWSPLRDGSCLIGYHHWQIEKDELSGLYQNLSDVQPGTKYTFSVYANVDAVTGEAQAAESIELRLETTLYDEQSIVASKKYKVSDLATGDEWSRLRVSAVAPQDQLRVLILIEPSASGPRGGALKLDAATLTVE